MTIVPVPTHADDRVPERNGAPGRETKEEMNTIEVEVGGQTITLETGRLAKQASGAVVVRCGDTMVLVSATVREDEREGQDFFPLTVDVEARQYAAGKIPGGFIKRESRPSDQAILDARLIDRPIRPLWPKGFNNETHIVRHGALRRLKTPYDVLATLGASAALTLCKVPFGGPVGAVRVGRSTASWSSTPPRGDQDEPA